MAKTPDQQARLAKALRDNLKRRKEQERQREPDPADQRPPAQSAVDKAGAKEGDSP